MDVLVQPNGHLQEAPPPVPDKSHAALKRIADDINFNKILRWTSGDDLDQLYALIEKPPLHSVVVHIEPIVAKHILHYANKKNRPLAEQYAERLSKEIGDQEYGLTGDTLKFSRSGRMIDGQHRLRACEQQTMPIITHIVFGLDDEIFDIIDQGRKRTPGDVLMLCGIKDYSIVAGAIRWAVQFKEGRKGIMGRGMTPRRIREMAQGPMKDISRYTKAAELIRKAYGIPPTMTAGLLYLISRKTHTLAEDFADSWVHGGRNQSRNKNFDTLAQRILTERHRSKGSLNRTVLAAMMVQTFNHWHAGVSAQARGITWSKEQAFPQLAFDTEAFLRERTRRHEMADDTLKGLQLRLLKSLAKAPKDKDDNVQVVYKRLSELSKVDVRQIGYVLRTLREEGYIHLVRAANPKDSAPAIWRMRGKGEQALAT